MSCASSYTLALRCCAVRCREGSPPHCTAQQHPLLLGIRVACSSFPRGPWQQWQRARITRSSCSDPDSSAGT
eukprot:2613225-Rhodomonas_salina.2